MIVNCLLQALPLTKSYSSDNEDIVEDVYDTAAYDGQFYEARKYADCSQDFGIKGHLLASSTL